MAIFRGIGGAGDSTTDATVTAVTEQATNAANSATAAASSASSASTSASAAAASASAAASSAAVVASAETNVLEDVSTSAANAAAAASSATAAASSASDAASSATDAETAQTAAEAAESNASTSASAAASSASSASSSASTATTQATNAASSASAAATSATNAANSATTASGYVSDAADQVTLATTQATNAANSATAASTSASSAASSAAAAAASLDSFDDRYLGAKSSAPTLDNDGNALITGALYYDTTEGLMFVYDGGQWIAASSASQAILTVYKYTATSGQTTFSGVDDNAATLGYTAGSIIVTLNGVFLESGDDYTATNGSSVVLSAGATTSDEVNIYSFNTFDVANVQVIGDERYVRLSTDQTVAGTKTLSSNPVLSAGTANGVTYLNGSKVLTSGSGLTFDGTNVGIGTSSPNNYTNYVTLTLNGTNGGEIDFEKAGTVNGSLFTPSGTSDFQVTAANASGNLRFSAGGYSEAMRLTSTGLGIGTSSPINKLDVQAGFISTYDPTNANGAGYSVRFYTNANAGSRAEVARFGGLQDGAGNNGKIVFATSTSGSVTEKMTLDSSGNLGLGVTPSGWGTGYKSLDIGSVASFFADGNLTANVSANQYIDAGGRKYKTTNYATMYQQYNGQHQWYNAPSGTAGAAISFTQAMTLDASGRLGIGATNPKALIDVVSGTNTTLSVPAGVVAKFKGGIVLNSLSTGLSGDIDSIYFQKSHTAGINISNYDLGIIRSYTNGGYAGGLDFYTGKNLGGGAYGATFAMRIDENQSVGIGTLPSAGFVLDVAGNIRSRDGGFILSNGTASKGGLYMYNRVTGSGSDYTPTIFSEIDIAFATGGSTTKRVVINSSGNVGIGATSLPSYARLHVSGTAGDQTVASQQLVINAPTTTSGHGAGIRFNAASGAREAVGIIGVVNEASGNAGAMTFHVYNGGGDIPEYMRIDSSGNLLVGGSTPTETFVFPSIQGVDNCVFVNKRNTTSSASQFRFHNTNGLVGEISSSGSTTTYATSSDYRLKENVVGVTGASARVQQLNPVRFNFIADPNKTVDGFLAHEVQDVVPEAITGTKDAVDADGNPVYQGIDQSKLVPLLTAALQEALAKIESLTARVSALEGN